ncbi:zinc-finger homeodomain protein 4 [Ricinus communis]|uniref:Transcription factor n=1 Tax=Ricinus communis TaxID=3988 RepID=B9RW99_RICCO|nr:zinc-finger homeodomain protein 4 [Ricinus communis]EEF44536.1 conserved hypothetical protein [Ricinus communis]|eukprot:XP_002518018.1 zinc-finger homeodomain protein 4 [Ricinus communis]
MEGEKEMNHLSPQKDMPTPRNSSCAGGNGHILITSSPASQIPYSVPTHSSLLEDQRPYKNVVVRYKECLKNHAAPMGGNATDGCGEFMPSGEQGSLEALKCSACNCHRNFHRKEIEGESAIDLFHSPVLHNPGGRFILGHHSNIIGSPQGFPINALLSSRPPPNQPMIVSYTSGSVPSESDEKDYDDDNEDGAVVAIRQVDQKLKKRFRTKFTEEQKQKMRNFAEKAGWKMQKLEESVVQRFCQEIGIKRRVLKVWMHNNKHHFSKKMSAAS